MTSIAHASIVAVLLVLGCNGAGSKDDDATTRAGASSPLPHAVPTATGGGPPSFPHQAEVERIARAHCGLFVRCGSVSPERSQSCFDREMRDVAEGIASNGCVSGIDSGKLNACLATMALGGGASCASSLPPSCEPIPLCGPPRSPPIDGLGLSSPAKPGEPDVELLRDMTARNAGTQRLIDGLIGPQRLDLGGFRPQPSASTAHAPTR